MKIGFHGAALRVENGRVRMMSSRATRRDERFPSIALLRVGSGESVPTAARAFSDRPRCSRKHDDRKRVYRSRDAYDRRWA